MANEDEGAQRETRPVEPRSNPITAQVNSRVDEEICIHRMGEDCVGLKLEIARHLNKFGKR